MFRRLAISLNAEATSSPCARLSSWHGPAMIEIGKSLPNLTGPTLTFEAAETAAFNGLVLFARDHAGQRKRDQPVFDVSNIRVAPNASSGGTIRRSPWRCEASSFL